MVFVAFLVIHVVKPTFPPNGKCFFKKLDGIYPYTGTPGSHQIIQQLDCLPSQNSFQFLAWAKLDAIVPGGELRYFFRYHTLINMDFRGSATGDHTLVLTKNDESPKILFEIPVGKNGLWMFIWLQVTENGASLAVRSTMNYELENHKLYKKSFGKLSFQREESSGIKIKDS